MLRRVASLLAIGCSLYSVPALADDTSPGAGPAAEPPRQGAPPLSYGFPWRPAASEPRSRGAVNWGIVLVSTGITAMILGTQVALAADRSCSSVTGPFGGPTGGELVNCVDKTAQIAGMAILIGGSLFTGGGIGLWIHGAEQVPRRSREAAARPMVVVGAGAAAIRWSF